MSAALNAGLVWPYHKPSSLIRLALYSLTFSVIIVDQLGRLNGQLKSFMADALMMLMMAYIVCIILQCIVLSDAKHQKNTRQILVTSQALEASDKLKNESEEQTRKLSLVARHANDSIIISDTYGRISWVNEAFSKITGYMRSEAIGRTPPDLLNDEATDLEVSKKIAQHIQAGDPIRAEVLNKRKDGEKVWVETNIVPVKLDNGSIEMIVAIERDIAAIKAHEQELAHAKVLAEKGERAKSVFLVTMSHEIRTPMNGIIGLSDLLADLDLSEDAQAYARTINESVDALLAIINDILDISKLDAGHLTIEPRQFDLNSFFAIPSNCLAPKRRARASIWTSFRMKFSRRTCLATAEVFGKFCST